MAVLDEPTKKWLKKTDLPHVGFLPQTQEELEAWENWQVREHAKEFNDVPKPKAPSAREQEEEFARATERRLRTAQAAATELGTELARKKLEQESKLNEIEAKAIEEQTKAIKAARKEAYPRKLPSLPKIGAEGTKPTTSTAGTPLISVAPSAVARSTVRIVRDKAARGRKRKLRRLRKHSRRWRELSPKSREKILASLEQGRTKRLRMLEARRALGGRLSK